MYNKELHKEYFNYNDYELLYLMSEHNEVASDIMYEKYQFLIKSKIKKFNISNASREDYFQEGMLVLNKAIKLFDSNQKCSFTNYFDLLLQRRFIDLIKKERKYENQHIKSEYVDYAVPSVNNHYLNEESPFVISALSSFEQTIFEMRQYVGLTPKQISQKLNVEVKQIYNGLNRIKKKISNQR